jgi:excisionase family DNA binding protein
MSRLALVSVHDRIITPQPAAFHELAAAKYVGMCRTKFRELVRDGRVPYAEHANGKIRIYLRADLDAYLESLKWRRMPLREVSPVAPKGVAE